MSHDFAALTPDLVQDALHAIGLTADGRLMALSSYENRVYLAHLEDGPPVVAKFYRPGRWSRAQIEEELAFATELAEAEVPVVAPMTVGGTTLHEAGGFLFSVSPRRGGRRPELDDDEVLEWTGRFIARLHAVGARRAFRHRPALGLARFALEPRDWLLVHDTVSPEVREVWRERLHDAINLVAQHPVFTRGDDTFESRSPENARPGSITPGMPACLRLHGDCHPGNILWTPTDQPGGGPHFVDLDDAVTGPAVQDLWMLLSGDRRERIGQLATLLDGYEQIRPFDRRELALIEPLRTLRLIHYSAWLARRWDDPAFRQAFTWFGSPDYWRGQVKMLDEQVEAMQEAPLECY